MSTFLKTIIVILILLVGSELSQSACQYEAVPVSSFVDAEANRCHQPVKCSSLTTRSTSDRNASSN